MLASIVAGAAACGSDASGEDGALDVWVSFAPLQYLAERVGGDAVSVANLVPPGADPHNVELSPSRVAELGAADLVVYVGGLQPATDEAIEQTRPATVVDTLEAATTEVPGEAEPPDPAGDPHFWLDPVRFALAGAQVADALAEIDPDRASEYQARAEELTADLETLDAEYTEALEPCAGATLVTSHEAFGYLAARYDLRQEGISGIDPEVEPSPARIREVGEIVEETGVRTLFFETAADPSVAQRLADDLGVETDVLDPMERPSDPDYHVVMRDNLDALTRGLVCG